MVLNAGQNKLSAGPFYFIRAKIRNELSKKKKVYTGNSKPSPCPKVELQVAFEARAFAPEEVFGLNGAFVAGEKRI